MPPSHTPPPFYVYNQPAKVKPAAGIFVTGGTSGGTSMVAGVLRILGVDMGLALAQVNEDQRIINAWAPRLRNLRDHPEEIAHVRNAAREAITPRWGWPAPWGWKDPRGTLYATAVRDLLPDPRLIVVFRDPMAAMVRHPDYPPAAARALMSERLDHYAVCLELARQWDDVPSAFVSYERAIRDPIHFVTPLARFIGVHPPQDAIRRACEFINADAGYQDARQFLDEETNQRQR
jgi:hypothetical protein